MTHSVDNVPSQQAVELVVVGPGFVKQCYINKRQFNLARSANYSSGVFLGKKLCS